MKGWLFTKTGVAPKLIEKEDPTPKDDEVVLDIKAAGLCHSDVAALEDPSWMNLITAAPVIFGHECAGVVSKVGKKVKDLKIGDRVGVSPQHPVNPLDAIGYVRDGGYATKLAVPAVQCVPLPDKVNFVQGASATDAGMTSYHALFTVGKAKRGMKVGIIGIGGLGQFAVQMAIAKGCIVYAVDINKDSRDLASSLGCKSVYSKVSDLKADAPELIVDFAGTGKTTADSIKAVAFKGTVVIVGMMKLTSNIDTYLMITKQLTVKGSNGGTPDDIKGVYKFFESGKLNPEFTTIPFEKIDKGLEMLKSHSIKGRLVALINQDEKNHRKNNFLK